ncbi:hypothetical protein PEC302107_25000 [Pectobacterium araliae]|uniref:Mannosyl-glycoprotein endo-beta-N-acetylglucosamidase-like domain-containing protein n=1 Tax=Pectobacterium araliae TaxID=3073862 RepID=A0AAN0MMZ4_9GAMM|nr:hypothetical protein PEC302110_30000 [Pectobacterium sp. MAFF 302110]GKW20771.1 hypothetical protein PEC302107_25000 [Pectobacterium carotovorum subsp. carotovorum]
MPGAARLGDSCAGHGCYKSFYYTDLCEWALGLQRAGYETDPDYANKLRRGKELYE